MRWLVGWYYLLWIETRKKWKEVFAGKTLSTCVISAGTNMFLNGKFSTCQYKDNEENNSIWQMQAFNYHLDSFEHWHNFYNTIFRKIKLAWINIYLASCYCYWRFLLFNWHLIWKNNLESNKGNLVFKKNEVFFVRMSCIF